RDGWAIGDRRLLGTGPGGWFIATKNLRRNINAASKDQLEGAEHHFALARFWDEPEGAKVEGFNNAGAVLLSGKHHHRNCGIALAQLGQHGKAIAIRQVEVEQNEAKVGMRRNHLHRLAAS